MSERLKFELDVFCRYVAALEFLKRTHTIVDDDIEQILEQLVGESIAEGWS